MAPELGLHSQNQFKKSAQLQLQLRQKLSMWNYTNHHPTIVDDDDSWEVRAFAEDTRSAMGTTWPPRSYGCNFCRREFRSAQALGGHMNVHRRDRARLQQSQHGSNPFPSSTVAGSSSSIMYSSPQFIANGGLCLFYPIPHPGSVSTPASADMASAANLPGASTDSCTPLLDKVGMMTYINVKDNSHVSTDDGTVAKDMDLELRLGW